MGLNDETMDFQKLTRRIRRFALAARLVGVLAFMLEHGPAIGAAGGSCQSLAMLSLPDTTITLAEPVGEGAFTPPASGRGAPMPYRDLPAFCRVALTVKPTSDSAINIEVWLPAAWNGKFNAVGTGGWAGSIGYPQLRDALKHGFATSFDGHGTRGRQRFCSRWSMPSSMSTGATARARDDGEGQSDHRGLYGNAPALPYWDGCSNGGRQGLQEAQRYPNDFDGIVAGAPANYWSHMNAAMIWIEQVSHKDEASTIPSAKFSVIHAAVLAACDARDGVKDGVLEDPTGCRFDPGVLSCKGDDGPNCLTAKQVEAARAIYAPVVNPRTKRVIYPGLSLGSELGWTLLAGPRALSSPVEFFQNVVFKDRNWDYRTLNFDRDVARAEKGDAGDAANPDLRPFFSHGGKLLQYHGWSDQALAPQYSIDYYTQVAGKVGGVKRLRDAYRLFMVPGMAHCTGGEGPNTFDMLTALDRWVQNGSAPDRIVASKLVNGAVIRTRPLCPYPQVAAYNGSGSTDEAASFTCKVP